MGYEVLISTTSESKMALLENNRIPPFLIDIAKPDATLNTFLVTDVLIIAIPFKNLDAFRNLIEIIGETQVKKVVFVSSSSVYPYTNGRVTEETPTAQTPLAEIEQLFIANTAFATTILRFGGLFGYDRKPGKFIRTNKAIQNPDGFVNLIHRDDCLGIIEQIILQNVWNEVFNACAESHPKRRDFYFRETRKLGAPDPIFDETSESSFKIVDSRKLINRLNYHFIHPDLMLID
ncbi:MAG: NAD-dependent epimerase/dehydratase family protein [Bacteroidetes bacterium]|nr:NAD-dependent epimerase/dehydratase family protein [Bacteroidota bacterium]